ncbi:hypothetical protein CDD83_5537 [Cordyceps sp. RAO-2017]|nr:hypothetical protein CDD83_5537 [Cordyceps sp. RAO-2017]
MAAEGIVVRRFGEAPRRMESHNAPYPPVCRHRPPPDVMPASRPIREASSRLSAPFARRLLHAALPCRPGNAPPCHCRIFATAPPTAASPSSSPLLNRIPSVHVALFLAGGPSRALPICRSASTRSCPQRRTVHGAAERAPEYRRRVWRVRSHEVNHVFRSA